MDKPYLSFRDQLDKIKSDYCLTVHDDELALESLIACSYYDLVNGYQHLFIVNGKFHENVSFDDIQLTHLYNKHIQSLFLKYASLAESSFKNVLSNIIGKYHTADHNEYLKPEKYVLSSDAEERKNFKDMLVKLRKKCNSCDDHPTKHYIEKHNHIPPWILLKNASFSNAEQIAKHLIPEQKEDFVNHFTFLNCIRNCDGEKSKLLIEAVRCIRKYRNQIAHNLDFLTYRSNEVDSSLHFALGNLLTLPGETNIYKNNIWVLVSSLIIILNSKVLISSFINELIQYLRIDQNLEQMFISVLEFPSDYEHRFMLFLENLTGVQEVYY